jgi:hypothetical protein
LPVGSDRAAVDAECIILRPDGLIVDQVILEQRAIAMHAAVAVVAQVQIAPGGIGDDAASSIGLGEVYGLHQLKVVIHIIYIDIVIGKYIEIMLDRIGGPHRVPLFDQEEQGSQDKWEEQQEEQLLPVKERFRLHCSTSFQFSPVWVHKKLV